MYSLYFFSFFFSFVCALCAIIPYHSISFVCSFVIYTNIYIYIVRCTRIIVDRIIQFQVYRFVKCAFHQLGCVHDRNWSDFIWWRFTNTPFYLAFIFRQIRRAFASVGRAMRPCLLRFSIVIVVVVAHRAKSTMSYFCAWTIRSSLGMRPFSNLISLLEGLNFSVIIVSLFPSPSPSPFRFLCVSHFQCIPNRYKLVDIGFYSHCIHSVLFYAFVLAHCVCFLVNCFIKQSLFRNFI